MSLKCFESLKNVLLRKQCAFEKGSMSSVNDFYAGLAFPV